MCFEKVEKQNHHDHGQEKKNGNGEKLSRTKKTQTKNPNIRKHEQTNKNLVHSGTLAI